MVSNFLSTLTTSMFLLLPFFFISPSLAKHSYFKDSNISKETICLSTPDPAYCNYILYNQTTMNAYGYSQFTVHKSWIQSEKFYRLVDKYIRKQQSSLPTPVIRALEDCLLLAEFNLDFLETSSQSVGNATESTLSAMKAESIQTYLSAILTNQQTCLAGIQTTASASSIKYDLMVPTAEDTKLNSVALALFTEAFVPKKRRESTWQPPSKHLAFRSGRLPLKMSSRTKGVYESVSGRNLLQIGLDDQVLVSDIVVVSQDVSGNFTTINDAVAAAPTNNDGSTGYFLIYVTAGVYEEYVSIAKNKKYLMMIGDGINQTIITGNRSVVDGWTTFNSATFAVVASNFVAVNMTFRNTAGAIKHQAVAVRNGADLSTFYSCSFEGYQDTLYTHSLRQFYRECDIYGTVDFIFGNAAVVFQNCNLYPRRPMDNQFNAITAQGRTDPNQNTGTSIINCVIKAADDLASSNNIFQTYLGRPWKQYSRTVYSQCFIDGLINPAGWIAWSGDFALSTPFYGEFGNTGPGSNTASRVTWPGYCVLNASDAAKFNVANFLLGDYWLPATGVPYASVSI